MGFFKGGRAIIYFYFCKVFCFGWSEIWVSFEVGVCCWSRFEGWEFKKDLNFMVLVNILVD